MVVQTKPPVVIEDWPVKKAHPSIDVWRNTQRKQLFGRYLDGESACALGVLWLSDILNFEAWALGVHDCPICFKRRSNGVAMVIHWNDEHCLTFTEIADLAEQYPEMVFEDA